MNDHSYFADDCTISVPAGFHDRSTNVLEWKTEEGDSLVLAIHRELLPPAAPEKKAPEFDLERFVAAQTKDYPAKFAGLRVERDEVAGSDAGFHMRRKAFRWQNKTEVLYHHQAFVLAGDRVIVLTAACKARHREAIDLLMDSVLANFRVRGD